uniref:Lysosomal dipeptide transporter MFSD1 n=2 Tax=Aplanochytrium stocchinoi TaxID=215587 RepID=A0A7S3V0U4_9STRA
MKHGLGPLKPFFVSGAEDALDLSHTDFGVFLAAASWPGMVLPLFAGFFVDRKGSSSGAILFTTLCLVGHTVFCIFLTPPLQSFFGAVVGRVIFGLGEGGTGVVQGAILGRWFDGKQISFVVGISESVHYLSNWLGKALPAAIATYFSGYVAALWIGSIFLFLSVCTSLLFYAVVCEERPFVFALARTGSLVSPSPFPQPIGNWNRRRLGSATFAAGVDVYGTFEERNGLSEMDPLVLEDDVGNVKRKPIKKEESHTFTIEGLKSTVRSIYSLPLMFWLLACLHLLFSNVHNLFSGFSADMIASENGQVTPAFAALLASVDAFFPIFFAPFIGFLVDYVGKRLWFCLFAALCSCVAFSLLLYTYIYAHLLTYTFTCAYTALSLSILSIVTSSTPTLVKSAVPLVVDSNVLGTAFGVYAIFEAFGGSTGHILLGYLRDYTEGYTSDLCVLFGLSIFTVILCFLVIRIDRSSHKSTLNLPFISEN